MRSTIPQKLVPILITGGSGFLGRHILVKLLKGEHGLITVVDHNLLPKEFAKKIRFIKGDFSDARLLEKAIQPGSIVVHLAGTSNQATAEKDPAQDAQTSIVGTLRLLDAAVSKKVSKLIFLSSAPAVYGGARK